ncbi:antibiotic biosynthesis monooxygenase [Streptomyces sp. NRRL F-5053]|uniref:antibiotic biosynthesis monooxygenase n=1 Tax=Streptomyces sp. NRRL F-5053 TaxID=1463854 RepID=UPI00068CD467|nr:antibiotic biosynthesis monooxygenase [Streptomyces sp. NRRL F-5053]
MNTDGVSLPDPADPRCDGALFGLWRLSSGEHAHAAAEAVRTVWAARPWPSERLLSYSVLVDTEGTTLLHCSQVTELRAPGAASSREQAAERSAAVDALVPGIERLGVIGARRHRSSTPPGPRDASRVGCVVLVTRELAPADADGARALVDTLFASGAGAPLAPGLIGAHFHISPDGGHVLNYAEWTDEQAHRAAVGAPPRDNADWERAHAWPGLVRSGFQRFRPVLTLLPGTREGGAE